METLEIQELIEKTLSGCAGAEEQRQLDEWYADFDHLPGLSETELARLLPLQLEIFRNRIFPKDPKFCLVIVWFILSL